MVKGPARFNVTQAARYLECDRQTVLRWRKRGLLADRATWTLAELDQAAESKPPKRQPKKTTPSSTSSGPDSTQAKRDALPAEGEEPTPRPPLEAAPGSSSSSTPERDPLDLNLPLPPKKGGDAGRTLPPVADANPATDVPASPPPAAAPAPADAPAPAPRTFFGNWRRS